MVEEVDEGKEAKVRVLQYAIAYSISRRLFRSIFPIRIIFVHIQLAAERAKKYYSLYSVTL